MDSHKLAGWQRVWVAALVLALAMAVYYWQFIIGKTFLWEDLLFYSYPSASYFSDALHSGRFPLWISGMRDGLPFYTNLNLTAFYPPLWLLAMIAPGGHVSVVAYQIYLVLQLVGGGLFAYWYLRDLRLHFGAAIVGMIVFVFSAFMSLHIVHANVITAFLWLPLQFLFVNRIVGRPFKAGYYLGLIGATLMSFLAGFPQVVMYNSYLVGGYWLFLHFQRQNGGSQLSVTLKVRGVLFEGAKVSVVFLFVILAGAAQFFPVAENWMLSARQKYTYLEIANDSLPWYYLIHGLVPNFFGVSSGTPGGVPFWGVDKESYGYSIWHSGAWEYWEFVFYAGQIALIAVAVVAFNFRRLWSSHREKMFFFLALLPVLILMTGRYGFLFPLFYHWVPGFAMFRVPARMGCLFDFCLAVNVAFIVNAVLEKNEALNLRRPIIFLGILYGLFIFWILVFGSSIFPELKNPALWGYSVRQSCQSVLLFGLLAAVLWFLARAKSMRWGILWVGLLAVLTFGDLYLAFQHFHGGRENPDEYYADRNGLIGQMTKMKEQNGPFRLAQLRDGKLSEEVIFPRNTGYIYPAYEAREGYILFDLKDWSAFNSITNERVLLDIQNMGVIANLDSRTRQVGLMRYTNSLPRVKFYHDIRAYADAKGLYADLEAGRLDYQRTLGVLSEECVKYGVSTAAPPARAEAKIHFTPINSDQYQISYQTTAPGVIFISESFYPGWEANAGQFPVIHAFGAFKGIVIPKAGSGVITVKFSPRVLWIGLAISLTTLTVLLGAWLWSAIRSGKKTR